MKTKEGLHPKNKHKNGYDFEKMTQSNPALTEFVFTNEYGTKTINFSNPKGVKELNKALLFSEYFHPQNYPYKNVHKPL